MSEGVMAVKTVKAARDARVTATGTAKSAGAVKGATAVKAARAADAALAGGAARAAEMPSRVVPGSRRDAGRTRVEEPAQRRVVAPPPPDVDPTAPELLTLARARDQLGLDYDEFEVALQLGEVPSVVCGPGRRRVPAEVVARLCAAEGHPEPLLARLRMVSSEEAARLLGVGRERFVRLARAGYLRPIRWYVNQYRAVVWMYLARELPEFADRSPALLHGPLPAGLREAVAAGEDQRPLGWRSRRTAQLVRDACDAWEEAAVWAALLGPEIVAGAMPDAYERAYVRRLRGELPPGRVGRASVERVRELTTADQPDEIARGLLALADALGRARALRPAPRPPLQPEQEPPLPPSVALPPLPPPQPSGPPGPSAPLAPSAPSGLSWPSAPTRSGPARGLRRLLLGRRSAPDPAKQPFLHDGDQQPPLPVEDLTARQAAAAGRDG
jgi:hypothetical protein